MTEIVVAALLALVGALTAWRGRSWDLLDAEDDEADDGELATDDGADPARVRSPLDLGSARIRRWAQLRGK